jgi:hypothetical protein
MMEVFDEAIHKLTGFQVFVPRCNFIRPICAHGKDSLQTPRYYFMSVVAT